MAEESIAEKAGFAVGFGVAAAENAAGAIKTAFESTVAAVGGGLKKEAAKRAAKKAPAKKIVAKKAVKKAIAKKAVSKKAAAKKAPDRKSVV